MQDLRGTSLEYLDAAFDEFNEALENAVTDNTESLALDIYTRATERTPVDTGRARAAWNISVGKENNKIPTEKKKIKRKNPKAGESRHITTYGRNSVTSINAKPYTAIYITNSLPYILALEDGHSAIQAPLGMLALAVSEVVERAKSGF